jgi:hydroxypyruvate reductase
VIASGPTVADPTTVADAAAILARHGIAPPGPLTESVKPGDARLAGGRVDMIAAPQLSLEAAARAAEAAGVAPLILGDAIEGEAAEVARVMAGIARQVVRHGQPLARPCVLLSGGETTVTVRGPGRGGRNVEFLLALAIALGGQSGGGQSGDRLAGVWALAADTDGIDGAEPVAGAVIGPDTLARARALGLDARAMLARNDAHAFFAALGDQVITGPTLTNVNDFRAILIGAT